MKPLLIIACGLLAFVCAAIFLITLLVLESTGLVLWQLVTTP